MQLHEPQGFGPLQLQRRRRSLAHLVEHFPEETHADVGLVGLERRASDERARSIPFCSAKRITADAASGAFCRAAAGYASTIRSMRA
jgi:hypothetical protein